MDANISAHPTSFLPPLIRLSTQSTQDVASAVDQLRNLYWPRKPPPLPINITLPQRIIARRIHDDSVPDSGYASAEEEDEEDDAITHAITHVAADSDPRNTDRLEVLRADILQREYAIKWTTGFIARSAPWIDAASSPAEHAARACLLDEVTGLLSAFVRGDDDPEEAAIMRTFTFATPDGGAPVTVQLNDEPLLEEDHNSVGLQSWGSCIRLGERICADPSAFSLSPKPSHRPLRVLELGAGTGLLSILAAKLLAPSSFSAPPPVVVATDYHPDVLANLSANIVANFPCPPPYPSTSPSNYTPVHVHALDWEAPAYAPPLLDMPFDVVLAADVVYHPEHARWIRGCVERVLRRPSPSPVVCPGNGEEDDGGVFWMIVAVRPIGRHEGLDRSVTEVFGKEVAVQWKGEGLRLAILEMEEAGKVDGVGRADESGYKLFKIGWKRVSSAGA